jgi:hypothetical protein
MASRWRSTATRPASSARCAIRPDFGRGTTQFGRVLFELNIDIMCANTSQAKGHVERANLTLQNRLVKELRLRGINTREAADAFAPRSMRIDPCAPMRIGMKPATCSAHHAPRTRRGRCRRSGSTRRRRPGDCEAGGWWLVDLGRALLAGRPQAGAPSPVPRRTPWPTQARGILPLHALS